MKKLKLDLERLAVETFDAGRAGAAGRGTVQGHVRYSDIRYCGSSANSYCYTDNEPECQTNWYGCATQLA